MAESRMAFGGRSGVPGNYGAKLELVGTRMGSWHNHHGRSWDIVLDHFDDHAQVHHEVSANQGCAYSPEYTLLNV